MRPTFVIDEVDRSLHTKLTQYLFEGFFDKCHDGDISQMIVTSHDCELINQDLFRRDEMWIITDENGQTELTSIADYADSRNDKDIKKSYLEGRMGGLPNLGMPMREVYIDG